MIKHTGKSISSRITENESFRKNSLLPEDWFFVKNDNSLRTSFIEMALRHHLIHWFQVKYFADNKLFEIAIPKYRYWFKFNRAMRYIRKHKPPGILIKVLRVG